MANDTEINKALSKYLAGIFKSGERKNFMLRKGETIPETEIKLEDTYDFYVTDTGYQPVKLAHFNPTVVNEDGSSRRDIGAGVLAAGGVGKLKETTGAEDRELVVKSIKLKKGEKSLSFEERVKLAEKEVHSMKSLELFAELIVQGEHVHILMEKVRGRALKSFIDKNKLLETDKLDIAYQVATELEKIHARGYIHADIKPENIMWDPQTRTARLIDFGSVTKIGEWATSFTEDFSPNAQRTGVMVHVEDTRARVAFDTHALGRTFKELGLSSIGNWSIPDALEWNSEEPNINMQEIRDAVITNLQTVSPELGAKYKNERDAEKEQLSRAQQDQLQSLVGPLMASTESLTLVDFKNPEVLSEKMRAIFTDLVFQTLCVTHSENCPIMSSIQSDCKRLKQFIDLMGEDYLERRAHKDLLGVLEKGELVSLNEHGVFSPSTFFRRWDCRDYIVDEHSISHYLLQLSLPTLLIDFLSKLEKGLEQKMIDDGISNDLPVHVVLNLIQAYPDLCREALGQSILLGAMSDKMLRLSKSVQGLREQESVQYTGWQQAFSTIMPERYEKLLRFPEKLRPLPATMKERSLARVTSERSLSSASTEKTAPNTPEPLTPKTPR